MNQVSLDHFHSGHHFTEIDEEEAKQSSTIKCRLRNLFDLVSLGSCIASIMQCIVHDFLVTVDTISVMGRYSIHEQPWRTTRGDGCWCCHNLINLVDHWRMLITYLLRTFSKLAISSLIRCIIISTRDIESRPSDTQQHRWETWPQLSTHPKSKPSNWTQVTQHLRELGANHVHQPSLTTATHWISCGTSWLTHSLANHVSGIGKSCPSPPMAAKHPIENSLSRRWRRMSTRGSRIHKSMTKLNTSWVIN